MSMSVPDVPLGHLVILKNKNAAQGVAAQVAALGGSIRYMHEEVGLALVDGLSDASAATLAGNSGVSQIMRDEEYKLDTQMAERQEVSDAVEINSQANPATAARYSWQWNMRLIGANTAWAANKLGAANVTVAIIDTGLDYDNLDLNGLVDLSRSTSFVPGDDAIRNAFFPTRSVVDDYNGHGTNVATQVSSKAVATAGVTSKTTLIGVKVLGFTGSGSTGGVLAGILWAADHGANIANMSLGSSGPKAGGQGFVSLFNKVFNYANKKNMIIVVSAGNAASNLQANGNIYSAYCDAPHVVCVSSVGPRTELLNQDEPSYFTNYGRGAITVSAPGGSGDQANGFPNSARPWGNDTRSWVWSLCARRTIVQQGNQLFLTICSTGNFLNGYVGTSQASPHAAGLLASLMAEGQNAMQARNTLVKSAVKVDGNGTSLFHGAGRISVSNALGL